MILLEMVFTWRIAWLWRISGGGYSQEMMGLV